MPWSVVQLRPVVAGHPKTGRPFLCVRGTRQYHTHPQHSGDSWLLSRAQQAGSLFTLCDRVFTTMVRNIIGLQAAIQTLPPGLSQQAEMNLQLAQGDVDALEQALQRRRPDRGLVHHSDQGSQYVSLAFGRRCRLAGIEQSMGGRGSAYDNAVCESFFKTLKSDLVDRRSWPTKAELRTSLFDYIECSYNRQRRHSSIDYHSPAEYERITEKARAA